MNEENQPLASLADLPIQAMLQRAMRNTLILGVIPAILLWIARGWRDAAMLATGTLISAVSIFGWQRLVLLINARLDGQKTSRSALWVIVFFVSSLTGFAGIIYGSLKCFHGSVVALLCGLALAFATIAWEALKLLKD